MGFHHFPNNILCRFVSGIILLLLEEEKQFMKKWMNSTSFLFLAFIFYFNAVAWIISGKKALVCVWFICATVELIVGIYYRRKEKKQLDEDHQE